MHSWEQELERPRYVMDKMWQNMQSNDTETMNLDKDIEELVNKVNRPKQQNSGQEEEDDP